MTRGPELEGREVKMQEVRAKRHVRLGLENL